MSELSIFAFESAAVRTLDLNDEPWFVATDVAKILGYRDARDMARMLDDDEKGTHNLRTLGGEQELYIISESGLYACILKSRRPEAKAFRKWVTSEVLPAIRKNGGYAAPGAQPGQQFITGNLSHGADIAVAADRTFRGFLRSARSAGLRLPQALRVANRQTLARTGLDMLAELDIDASEAFTPPTVEEDDFRVAEFIGAWLDGHLPLPVVVCRSSDLYAAYRHWATKNGIANPSPQTLFIREAERAAQDLVFRVVHVAERPGERRSARAVIPPGSFGVRPATSGQSNAKTIPEFAQAVKDWR